MSSTSGSYIQIVSVHYKGNKPVSLLAESLYTFLILTAHVSALLYFFNTHTLSTAPARAKGPHPPRGGERVRVTHTQVVGSGRGPSAVGDIISASWPLAVGHWP